MTAGLNWLKRPIAHRGLHEAARGIVENTSSAFQAALDAGYAMEADVRLTGDDKVVVFHDESLDRLTTTTGTVGALDVAALKRAAFRDTKDRIQTLPELLEQISGRVPLLIEAKSGWIRHGIFERQIAADLAAYKGPVAVASFDPRCIAAFAQAAPDVARGLVSCRFDDPHVWQGISAPQRFILRHLLGSSVARPQFIAYDIRALPATAPLLARHVFGWPLLTWTVRTDAERAKANRWADAMIFEGFRP